MGLVNAREAFQNEPGVEVVTASAAWICLRVAADLRVKDAVVGFFRKYLAEQVSAELSEQLSVALDELLTNAIEHGGAVPGVGVTYIQTTRSVLFHLRDGGPGFSLENANHAAINNPPGHPLRHAEYRAELGLRPGGFGILLVKQIADELIYNETGNEALLIKYL
jgi:anti-sigma regulatory factor (Ser/Thr protein kinase)